MLTFVAAALLAAASSGPGPCALVPPDAIASAQGARFVSSKESRSKGPAVERRDCFYQTDPFVDSVSLEWVADSVPGAARKRWSALFHGAGGGDPSGRREEHEHPKAAPAPVAGAGEEAYWVAQPHGGALYVLAGDAGFLRVSVGGAGKPEEKRDRCRRIAARAVESLRSASRSAKGK
jgi:hypothetical protein